MSPAQWMRYSRANQNKCAGQMPLPRSLHWHKAPGSFIPLAVNRPLSRSLGRLTRLYPSYRDRRIYGPLLRWWMPSLCVWLLAVFPPARDFGSMGQPWVIGSHHFDCYRISASEITVIILSTLFGSVLVGLRVWSNQSLIDALLSERRWCLETDVCSVLAT